LTVPLAFVDTETTGIHPGRRAWEIAIIRRDTSGLEHTALLQISDVDLSNADPFGLKVGRFYDRHADYIPGLVAVPPTEVVTEAQAASIVERMTRGAHLVGAVPNFDAEVFADMLRRHKLTPAWHYHLVDVENLAVGYLAHQLVSVTDGPRTPSMVDVLTPPWSSEELSRMCGVDPAGEDERHTALGDAKWAMRLYDAIVGQAVSTDA
jgi:hypothetical protein